MAAFEEQIGSHGGIGGQQTDAFLCHPADMDVPQTSNTTDLYPILNGRRGKTVANVALQTTETAENPWSWPVMWAGISDIQGLFNRAARSLRLDRTLFSEVANDPGATGQAVLISVLLSLGSLVLPLLSIAWWQQSSPMLISGVVVLIFGLAICLILATIAGRLNHRDRSFTRAFNAIAFAGVGGFVAWFAPINYVGPLLLITGTLIVLIASWLAIQEALAIPRWPAVLIPLLSFTLASLLLLAFDFLYGGGIIAISSSAG